MSPDAQHVVRKLALRVFKDPLRATVDDTRKLAKAVLLLVDGRLPR